MWGSVGRLIPSSIAVWRWDGLIQAQAQVYIGSRCVSVYHALVSGTHGDSPTAKGLESGSTPIGYVPPIQAPSSTLSTD